MSSRLKKPIEIAVRWSSLGYKPDSITLLFVVPLVQVAWAEDFVQRSERRAILRFAADLQITHPNDSYYDLLEWLDIRPSNEFFSEATELLNDWLEMMTPQERESVRNVLLIGCLDVARSSRDIGLHPHQFGIRREEREQIYLLGGQLGFKPAIAN